jgi:tryptophan synthase alpha chain
MSRIQGCFEALAWGKRKALIPYITAGDPHPSLTVPLMRALVEGGADILELGVPFSDPMADGPVIQRAGERALKHGVGLSNILSMVKDFRKSDDTTPIVLMGYANPIEAMGVDRFVAAAKAAGVDGVIVVDYPPEECEQFAALAKKQGIDPVFLLAPTSTDKRIEQVARVGSGYLYYVSLRGITGAGHIDLGPSPAAVPRAGARPRPWQGSPAPRCCSSLSSSVSAPPTIRSCRPCCCACVHWSSAMWPSLWWAPC